MDLAVSVGGHRNAELGHGLAQDDAALSSAPASRRLTTMIRRCTALFTMIVPSMG
jgi:hypothetical protein